MNRTARFLSVLLIGSIGPALADQLIVRKDGTTVSATRVRVEGGKIFYPGPAGSPTISIPTNELDGVISTVTRGKAYDPEYIRKVIAKIDVLQARHPKLMRTLKPIREEWVLLQGPAPELDATIAGLVSRYQQSTRDTVTFKQVTMDLEMLRYKDVQGKYTKSLVAAVRGVRDDYVKVNTARLHAITNAPQMTVSAFVRARQLAEEVLSAADEGERTLLTNLVETARARTFDAQCRLAKAAVVNGRMTIDSFLQYLAVINPVKAEVAATPDHAERLGKLHAEVLGLMAKAQPRYRFDLRNFPLTDEDLSLFVRTQGFRSGMPLSSPSAEECLAIPMDLPAPLPVRAGAPFAMPLRLVFRAPQPAGRSYAGALHVPGQAGAVTQILPIPSPSITDARADIRIGATLSVADRAFVPATDTNGMARVFVYIVSRDDPGSDAAGWRPISYACVWPLSP